MTGMLSAQGVPFISILGLHRGQYEGHTMRETDER